MNIGVIGTGYVGLVQGVVLAEFGLNVICMDVNEEKISKLNKGIIPIYEPGLTEMLERNRERVFFTTKMKEVVEKSEVIFIAVGTPSNEDGSADIKYVLNAAIEIGKYINNYKVIVNKSTVPVGTGKKVKEVISKEIEKRGINIEFDVVSNPEFLREGKAIKDCILPDRVVIGTESKKAKEIMKKVYNVLFLKETPFVFTNIETAEMIKYASNAFLAVKISYINEMANLAEEVGANIQEIAMAMGMDGRISPKFLNAGPGFGGSCFPKDTRAIVEIAKKYGLDMKVVKAAIEANECQKQRMVEKIIKGLKSVKGECISVLGLSFKPDTDDMREAPSINIIRGLVDRGAKIRAFCPEGMKEAKWRLADIDKYITYCNDEYDAVKGTKALVIITEWHRFRGMDLKKIKRLMNDNYLFDLRNVFAKDKEVRHLFKYYSVGTISSK